MNFFRLCVAILCAIASSGEIPAASAPPDITRHIRSPSTEPGRMASAVMPSRPSSIASVLVNPTTAHSDAA